MRRGAFRGRISHTVPSGPAPPASAEERDGRFLNISSIRSVTTKPPTAFAVASSTAKKPATRQPDLAQPRPLLATQEAPQQLLLGDRAEHRQIARMVEQSHEAHDRL